jgi:hypothetical protein
VRFASPQAASERSRSEHQAQNGRPKSAAGAAAFANMNQGKSALDTLVALPARRGATPQEGSTRGTHPRSHNPALFSAFFHKFHILPLLSYIGLRACILFSFPFCLLLHTVGPLFSPSTRSCSGTLAICTRSRSLVRPRPTRVLTSSPGARCPFLSYTLHNDPPSVVP